MRRGLITDWSCLEEVLRRAQVLRLGFVDEGGPYVVPVCFGYEDGAVYFHGSPLGRKMDAVRAGGRVCFETEVDVEPVPADEACRWGMRYRSVIGFGRPYVIEDVAEKRRALDIIMAHYSEGEWTYPEESLARVAVVRIDIEEMTGRSAGH